MTKIEETLRKLKEETSENFIPLSERLRRKVQKGMVEGTTLAEFDIAMQKINEESESIPVEYDENEIISIITETEQCLKDHDERINEMLENASDEILEGLLISMFLEPFEPLFETKEEEITQLQSNIARDSKIAKSKLTSATISGGTTALLYKDKLAGLKNIKSVGQALAFVKNNPFISISALSALGLSAAGLAKVIKVIKERRKKKKLEKEQAKERATVGDSNAVAVTEAANFWKENISSEVLEEYMQNSEIAEFFNELNTADETENLTESCDNMSIEELEEQAFNMPSLLEVLKEGN